MTQYINIIKGTYLQYVRSYSFLITIAISLFLAFGIIPSPDANYTTMKFGAYTGAYNSTWIGLVTAIMASVFLSLFGFFLINGSIKKDIDSRIGHIIGTTKISNVTYIFTKIASNFLILLTILGVIFFVSIMLFFLYGEGYSFRILDFITPYIIITVPSLICVATLSVVLEIVFPRKTTFQYSAFFILIIFTLLSESNLSKGFIGIHYPTNCIATQVEQLYNTDNASLIIGFVSGGRDIDKIAEISSITYPNSFILSRIIWILFALIIGFIGSQFFHRFDIKQRFRPQQKLPGFTSTKSAGFQLKNLIEPPEFSAKLMPLICAEMILLIRKNAPWLWISTGIGMISLIFVPVNFAHQFILPILWFLQVTVWSDIVTKDFELRTHYFAASSYKPMRRLFISRIIAGFSVALVIATPILIRLALNLDFIACINIVLGGAFIVLIAIFFGVLTKSKKLFEISFFFLIYCNINSVPITDYFGAIHSSVLYTITLLICNIILFSTASFIKMNYERS